MHAALVYPHQLYEPQPAVVRAERVYLVEEPLFFRQYQFHRQKLMLHRAALQCFAAGLKAGPRPPKVRYVAAGELTQTGDLAPLLAREGVTEVCYVDPEDDWLARRLASSLQAAGIAARLLPNPHFLTPWPEWEAYVAEKPRLFFTDFYVRQRKRLGLLLDARGKPQGGQWSFDPANRKKPPRGLPVPAYEPPAEDVFAREARAYVAGEFPGAIGAEGPLLYPASRPAARRVLEQFVVERLPQFGDYEDAIAETQTHLFHSVLTPALNCGLLSPQEVLEAVLARAQQAGEPEVPLNALEGFVRQVCGWREYLRGVYRTLGRRQRTTNFWGHTRPLPAAFYRGATGVEPVDTVIRRVLQHGYCHHIERLMILGNFLLLCEIDPDEIYRWFMELFVDAYDWVMVPNVYGMSQYADGGRITTKPYLSGSSYVLRMSDFRRGPWCDVWDALFWRFVARRRDFFAAQPRLSMLVRQLDRLGPRRARLEATAETFLTNLFGDHTGK